MTCQAELRGLEAIQGELESVGVQLVALSVDSPQQSRDVVRRGGLSYPILADEERTVTRELGLLHPGGGPDGSDIALPAHVLIDENRLVRWRYVADRIQNRLSPDSILQSVRSAFPDNDS